MLHGQENEILDVRIRVCGIKRPEQEQVVLKEKDQKDPCLQSCCRRVHQAVNP